MINLRKISDTTHIRSAAFASVVVASILIVLKFFAWEITHSVSLQGSLIDSLLDALASLITMIAVYHATKPADKEHRFGHGKAESLAALGQTICICITSLWVLYEAKERFSTPEPIKESEIGIIIMGIAMILTMILIIYQAFVIKKTGSSAIAADRVHYQSDFLINGAVMVSLVGSKFFHLEILDSLFGVFIGLYILWTALKITVKAFNVLMDRELEDEEREKILSIIKSHPEVFNVKDLRTRTSGLQQFFQLRLLLQEELPLCQADQIACEVEKEIIKAYPKSQLIIRLEPIKKRSK